MFERLLIANRGEIACRIIRTCRRLGIETAVVYSAHDRDALHVRLADYAYPLTGASVAETYLNGAAIVAAAERCGAQAIHPGYGFLAENAAFARAVEQAGLIFVGPTAATIEKMGSKAAAKAVMRAAGVPVVPGDDGAVQDDDHLAAAAGEIGYPVLLKAAAGGGGKGMRLVKTADDFAAALATVRREALGAFGDDQVIIEKYLAAPRHIEVQVFGDRYGNLLHLYERDCSAQRRHQKIVEEAPAPGLDLKTRQAIHRAALAAARAVEYLNAGTVEMIMEENSFYFMEMNTRLQVEHPVTEAVTGLDLVEWQLRIAAGEALPLSQEHIDCRGHAVEARLYAEDPARGFLPSSGTLTVFTTPAASNGNGTLRIDSGYEAGDRIGVHYDPMIAKFIAHGTDRATAVSRLHAALAHTALAGPHSNLGFLQSLLSSPEFSAAQIRTATIDRDVDHFLDDDADLVECAQLLAIAARLAQQTAGEPANPWLAGDGWSNGAAQAITWRLALADCEAEWRLENTPAGWRVYSAADLEANNAHLLSALRLAGTTLTATLDGIGHRVPVLDEADRLALTVGGRRFTVAFLETHDIEPAVDPLAGGLHAPMPGKIVAVRAAAGEQIASDQPLIIMEAMKMEITLRAPAAGTVQAIHVGAGDFVAADALLIGFAE